MKNRKMTMNKRKMGIKEEKRREEEKKEKNQFFAYRFNQLQNKKKTIVC